MTHLRWASQSRWSKGQGQVRVVGEDHCEVVQQTVALEHNDPYSRGISGTSNVLAVLAYLSLSWAILEAI